ncbi:MAG: zinc ribbon domain-containing protein [Treponema sp.]|nr:zinc ribbon domain-containing protein [Treponema sp.]
MQETMTICQSCSMPMTKPEDFGKEADGSASKDYCCHCYPKGAFNSPNETMEEMIETCIPFCREYYESDEAARADMTARFPKLKRWAKA